MCVITPIIFVCVRLSWRLACTEIWRHMIIHAVLCNCIYCLFLHLFVLSVNLFFFRICFLRIYDSFVNFSFCICERIILIREERNTIQTPADHVLFTRISVRSYTRNQFWVGVHVYRSVFILYVLPEESKRKIIIKCWHNNTKWKTINEA